MTAKTIRSDNIAQFYVSERDVLTFPVMAVANRPHIRAPQRYKSTVYTPEVDAVVDVLRQLAQMAISSNL